VPDVPQTHNFEGGPATSSEMDTYVRDVLIFLQRRPFFELRQTVGQTIATSTGTVATFTTEDYDTDPAGTGGHSNSVNTSRWTCQYPGVYSFGGIVAWTANATGRRAGWWQINGTAIAGSQFAYPATAASDGEFVVPLIRWYFSAGDYLELIVYHERGANLDTFAGVGATAGTRMGGIWERLDGS